MDALKIIHEAATRHYHFCMNGQKTNYEIVLHRLETFVIEKGVHSVHFEMIENKRSNTYSVKFDELNVVITLDKLGRGDYVVSRSYCDVYRNGTPERYDLGILKRFHCRLTRMIRAIRLFNMYRNKVYPLSKEVNHDR